MNDIKTINDLLNLKLAPLDVTKEFKEQIKNKFGLNVFLTRCKNDVVIEYYNPDDYEEIDTDIYGVYLHYKGKTRSSKIVLPYNCRSMIRMFDHVDKKVIDLSCNDLSQVVNIREAFRMSSTEKVIFGKQDMSNLEIATGAFMWCSKLKYTDIGLCHMSNLRVINGMFYSNKSLVDIDLSAWIELDLMGSLSMFVDCKNLKRVILGNLLRGGITGEKLDELIKDCPCLKSDVIYPESQLSKIEMKKVSAFG